MDDKTYFIEVHPHSADTILINVDHIVSIHKSTIRTSDGNCHTCIESNSEIISLISKTPITIEKLNYKER